MAGRYLTQAGGRHVPQLAVDERQQKVESFLAPAAPVT